jgi:GDP/UDP-N,N'-diacetylbacillosamine 2-epimerase (hydrolysing)
MKNICVVTGSRAEYGLLRPLLAEIKRQKDWHLQLVATGMHLSPEFGLTYKEIEKDGFHISKKVEMLLSSDTEVGIIKSMGIGLIGFADVFKELHPDLIIILGDRFEMLAVAEAALIHKIPVAHLHGGEITEGAYDDSIRHAITKMSHIHFVATEQYRYRVIQMGENPKHVFNVGAIGLDNINNAKLFSRKELKKKLKIEFKKYNYLVTFHPATLNKKSNAEEFQQLLLAVDQQKESLFIFTKANADNGGRKINQMIDDFVFSHSKNCVAFASMGSQLYLSVLQFVDAVVGNSSSGILEAPAFKVATINIGERQKGRIQPSSIINCEAKKQAIENAFNIIKDAKFKSSLSNIVNPYGDGKTSTRIVQHLQNIQWNKLVKKSFYDLDIKGMST